MAGAELLEDGTNLVPFAVVLSPGEVKVDRKSPAACYLIDLSCLISQLLSAGDSGSGSCITK